MNRTTANRFVVGLALGLPALALGACHAREAAAAGAPTNVQCPSSAPTTPVATVGGKTITLADVDKKAQQDLYDVREKALDQMINDEVIGDAARKAHVPEKDFLQTLVAAKVPEVSESEAKDFYEKNKDRLPPQFQGQTWEQLKPIVVAGLTDEKRKEALGGIVDDLRSQAGVKVMLEQPRVEVAATGPSRGNKNAPITIVEFSDFQCPFCARGRKTLDEVRTKYGDKVRVVYRDYPLPFHEHAQKAAEAGRCADEQGKFWAMHDWMFDHQDSLDVPSLEKAASDLKLDGGKFKSCLESGKFAGAVADDEKAGEAAGVHGTPAFFINGVSLSGAQPFERFKAEIDKQLDAQGGKKK